MLKKIKAFFNKLYINLRLSGSSISNRSFVNTLGKYSSIKTPNSGKVLFNGPINIRDFVCFNANEGDIHFGKNVFVNSYTSINSQCKVSIGDNVLIGEGVRIYDHDHNYRYLDERRKTKFIHDEIKIGDGVWIGSNSVILKGSTIGDYTVISAGSIVSGIVPAESLYFEKSNIKKIKRII